MNFVDPKEYDIPGLVRKNRYKTILPSKHKIHTTSKSSNRVHCSVRYFIFTNLQKKKKKGKTVFSASWNQLDILSA